MKQLVSKTGAGSTTAAGADSTANGTTPSIGGSVPGLHTDPINQKGKMSQLQEVSQ